MEKAQEKNEKLVEETQSKQKIDLSGLAEALAAITTHAATIGAEWRESINNFTAHYTEVLQNIAPYVQAAVEGMKKLPEDLEVVQTALAERGWFVLPGMPAADVRGLRPLIEAGDFGKVDHEMVSWTYTLLDEMEAELCKLYPHREGIIREGFDNHRNKRYASAITLLLTQVDGICYEIFNEVFFVLTKWNHATPYVPKVNPVIDGLGLDPFAKLTLNPILQRSGINAWETDIAAGAYPDSPHRHPIMHGKDTTYPNELNSWKIISFLGYMGDFVRKVKESAPTP